MSTTLVKVPKTASAKAVNGTTALGLIISQIVGKGRVPDKGKTSVASGVASLAPTLLVTTLS